jgi:DNA-directed RNA polymerase beta' subunit
MKKSELKQLIREAIEEVKPKVEEEVINEGFAPETDEVGEFWVVEKPSTSTTLDDICFKCENVMYFARQVVGGLKPEDIKGVFINENKAKKLAEKLLKERDKKKDEVKKAAEAYKKMKEETLAKVQEYMKNKKATKDVVDELKDLTDK